MDGGGWRKCLTISSLFQTMPTMINTQTSRWMIEHNGKIIFGLMFGDRSSEGVCQCCYGPSLSLTMNDICYNYTKINPTLSLAPCHVQSRGGTCKSNFSFKKVSVFTEWGRSSNSVHISVTVTKSCAAVFAFLKFSQCSVPWWCVDIFYF